MLLLLLLLWLVRELLRHLEKRVSPRDHKSSILNNIKIEIKQNIKHQQQQQKLAILTSLWAQIFVMFYQFSALAVCELCVCAAASGIYELMHNLRLH